MATAAEGVPGWPRSQVFRCRAAVSVMASDSALAGVSLAWLARAPARLWVYQATPWVHPVPVRAVDPSKMATVSPSGLTKNASSFGASGEPGSELAVTCTLGSVVPVQRGEPAGGQDLSAVGGVELAGDQHREPPGLQLPVQLGEVVGDVVGGAENARGVDAREIQEAPCAVGARQPAEVGVVAGVPAVDGGAVCGSGVLVQQGPAVLIVEEAEVAVCLHDLAEEWQ